MLGAGGCLGDAICRGEVCLLAVATRRFSGFSDLFDCFDRDIELSGFVPAPHVGVEALKSMFLLEGSDLFREVELLASLSEIACDLVQLHFAHGVTACWKRTTGMLGRT